MNTPFTDEEYEYIVAAAEQQALNSFWLWGEEKFPTHEERRDAFLWILERALNDGKLIIVGEDYKTPLPGTPQEIVQLFRETFPKSLLEVDQRYLPHNHPSIGEGMGMSWWLYGPPDGSPGHPLWRVVHEDGKVEWIPG